MDTPQLRAVFNEIMPRIHACYQEGSFCFRKLEEATVACVSNPCFSDYPKCLVKSTGNRYLNGLIPK